MQGERKTQRPDSARGRYVKEVKGWHLVWFVFFSPRLKMQSLERSFGCSYVLHSFKRSTTRGLCRCVCACRSSRARLPGLCSTVCGAGRAQGRALAKSLGPVIWCLCFQKNFLQLFPCGAIQTLPFLAQVKTPVWLPCRSLRPHRALGSPCRAHGAGCRHLCAAGLGRGEQASRIYLRNTLW